MTLARSLFVVLAIPFTLSAGLMVIIAYGFPDGLGTGNVGSFALYGCIFIYGSIFALDKRIPFGLLVVLGLLLNSVGAVVWLRCLGSRDVRWMGWIGVWMAGFWLVALVDAYRKRRRVSDSVEEEETEPGGDGPQDRVRR